jgi:SAM-dependent methyltransferase
VASTGVQASYSDLVDPWDRARLEWRFLSGQSGAMVRPDGKAYPVTDGVVRLVNVADGAHNWVLDALELPAASAGASQPTASVASFGFQWSWDNEPRTEADLQWRTASRYHLSPDHFSGKRILDAGCGAGAQSAFLARHGAKVVSIDLSDAINVAGRRTELRHSLRIQGDIAHLPLPDEYFDVVYCEGVLQHTRELGPVLAEFRRVLRPGGTLLAAHYVMPRGVIRKARLAVQERLRAAARGMSRDSLFLASGVGAAMSLVPGLGKLLTSTVIFANPRMPGLRPTWSATYDAYGLHEHQRYLTHEDFRGVVGAAGFETNDVGELGVVRATRQH